VNLARHGHIYSDPKCDCEHCEAQHINAFAKLENHDFLARHARLGLVEITASTNAGVWVWVRSLETGEEYRVQMRELAGP
jgi:hypothetical protein